VACPPRSVGTIMAVFVPNSRVQAFEKPSGRPDLNRRPLEPPGMHPHLRHQVMSMFPQMKPRTGEQNRAAERTYERP